MTIVPVALAGHGYDVAIVPGAIEEAGVRLGRYAPRGRVAVVTDETVAAAWLPRLEDALGRTGIGCDPIVLPPGEGSKSWVMLERLVDRLLALGIERADHVIAFGGGVIGDLVGFACSMVKRGCGFVQMPTTLLAQVDSSVGGKTAINTTAGKNLVGSFYQPAHVLIDPMLLVTLPRRELASGYAEVVKYGLIDDAGFFAWCERHAAALIAGDASLREHAIARSVSAKARIVAADERETTGVRALLNLGHTFGHALEAETGFSPRLLHGEAVACGMALAFGYSVRRGFCDPHEAARVDAHLAAIGLPTTLAAAGVDAPGAQLVAHMAHDKKMTGGRLPFLLARGIGRSFLATDVDLADVADFLDGERSACRTG